MALCLVVPYLIVFCSVTSWVARFGLVGLYGNTVQNTFVWQIYRWGVLALVMGSIPRAMLSFLLFIVVVLGSLWDTLTIWIIFPRGLCKYDGLDTILMGNPIL